MKKGKLRLLAVISMIAMLVLAACNSDSTSDGGTKEKDNYDNLSILTGGAQGTYYPLGGSFADFISKETGIKTDAEVSQASAANMIDLKEGAAEIAFVQTDIAYYAANGELMFEDEVIDEVSAIGSLYPETVQLVTLEKSGIKSFEDLKGKKVSVGAIGSGTEANAKQLLEIHGLTMDDIDAQNLDFGESQESIQSGQIDAAFVTAGTPTGAVEGLNAVAKVFIVPIEDAKADELIEKYPYYAKEVIPSGTYGSTEDTNAVSVGAMLVVKNELPEDLVYEITKAVYDNASTLTHDKGQYIKAETGLDGVGIDVHPGAQKYFDEVNGK
ncbi:TAXI family TRAP transporter solute-binding subunit [Sporosarcina pasteurii]|uniref:ABC-type taurine transport system, periplasmic component n=1 Tax=Sporosarcina pasteurii TaxID=1474 RepID=A0A380BES3_SPOPA|nr:TAXI family TRAP transporter solute-binding subunit [Sporosarcina pasteurii]MDS9470402.1 TAXI family TRAP transporter solute-binding subunit [Sporosarcina pasteurii]QBQ05896.1 TAXI family TRAP transporter solute-binding subunit [Sporosarcina pasteurii]SUJ00182.1 ABC-type taurine transport system, periplasmic component [Sporosarcina pasteurii]